jgi:hypothetical protein
MQKRNLVKMVIFQVLTFGLYYLYWLYQTKTDLNKKGADLPPMSSYFLLFPLICIFGIFVAAYSIATILNYSLMDILVSNSNYIKIVISLLTYIMTFIVCAPIVYFYYKLSEAFEKYVAKDNSQMAYFIILATCLSTYVSPLVFFVPLILQYKINQSLEK